MSAAAWELQKTIFEILTAALGGSVIVTDEHPTSAFPLVQLGETQPIADDTSADAGSDSGVTEFLDLHIWSRHRGWMEAKEIEANIRAALHEKSLTVIGCASAHSFWRRSQYLRDPDGLTRHAVVTFEIIHRSK